MFEWAQQKKEKNNNNNKDFFFDYSFFLSLKKSGQRICFWFFFWLEREKRKIHYGRRNESSKKSNHNQTTIHKHINIKKPLSLSLPLTLCVWFCLSEFFFFFCFVNIFWPRSWIPIWSKASASRSLTDLRQLGISLGSFQFIISDNFSLLCYCLQVCFLIYIYILRVFSATKQGIMGNSCWGGWLMFSIECAFGTWSFHFLGLWASLSFVFFFFVGGGG